MGILLLQLHSLHFFVEIVDDHTDEASDTRRLLTLLVANTVNLNKKKKKGNSFLNELALWKRLILTKIVELVQTILGKL